MTVDLKMQAKTIIFDLGGVIIDIDPQGCFERFRQMARDTSHPAWQQGLHHPLFMQYEKGRVGDVEFLDELKTFMARPELSHYELEAMWNTMLVDISIKKMQLLEQLRQHYRLIILSNTNHLHMRGFNNLLLQKFGKPDFRHWFHALYYSFEMGHRKPEEAIYSALLQAESGRPEEFLFLDDNLENVQSAQQMGIQAIHVQSPDQILSLF
jgi:putative hydrolase of the HAD superfamily